MSLVVTDGDGEQNEMRMLQDKLGATMKVVNTLTTQLTELKEQVQQRTSYIPFQKSKTSEDKQCYINCNISKCLIWPCR